MVQERYERKLIAILSADACGYSRLISSNVSVNLTPSSQDQPVVT